MVREIVFNANGLDLINRKWIVSHVTIGGRPFQKHKEAYILNNAPPAYYDYARKIVPNGEHTESQYVRSHKRNPKLWNQC